MTEGRSSIPFTKAHAYGNDFLIVRRRDVPSAFDPPALVRRVCDRHRGLGADGVLFIQDTDAGADTELFNADGSRSELSGNGVRCVAATLALERESAVDTTLTIGTGAGPKPVTIVSISGRTLTCRTAMGPPDEPREVVLEVAGAPVTAVVMRVGNPQCVVLGLVTDERLHRLGSALAVHPFFPEGTNVELATVERADRVRMLIWERGVGPTEASGTGACAAAVAAAAFGGATRRVEVASPGGVQRVEWTATDLLLTGDAQVIGSMAWWPA